MAAVAVDDRHEQLEERVQRGDDLGRGRALGERGETGDVAEHDRHVDLYAALGEAAGEDEPGDVLVEVGAEGLADALALGESDCHPVERVGELAELVARDDGDAHVVIAAAHECERVAQARDRAGDRSREQQRELEREREADEQCRGDTAGEHARAASVAHDGGDDEAGHSGEHGQADEQTAADREPIRGEGEAVGEPARDALDERAHEDL